MEDSIKYIKSVIREIGKRDKLHANTLKRNILSGSDYDEISDLIYDFFRGSKINPKTLADDYLHMIGDMRREGTYFALNGQYSCKSQQDAYEKVYSDPVVMSYYMNALIISQVLWSHHFKMLMYFRDMLLHYKWGYIDVLDVGTGHGLYSYLVRKHIPVNDIDVVDISKQSLDITRRMIGCNSIYFIQSDIADHKTGYQYDLIILGEILEHLDDPLSMLLRLKSMLVDGGYLWITVPTNAPAIDHVFLFKSKEEVFRLIKTVGLHVDAHFDCQIEGDTHLIGLFCYKNEIQ